MTQHLTCPVKFCRNESAPGRRTCQGCLIAADRKRYPMRTAYENTKEIARQHGLPFTLTLAEFITIANRRRR